MFNYNVNINSEQVMSLKTDYYPCMINYNVNINPEQVMSLKTTIQLSLFHYNVNINFLTSYEPYNHFSTVSVPQIALFSNPQSGNAKIFTQNYVIPSSRTVYLTIFNINISMSGGIGMTRMRVIWLVLRIRFFLNACLKLTNENGDIGCLYFPSKPCGY